MTTQTRTYASIYTTDGNELTAGLQVSSKSSEALQAAQRFADERGEDVVLLDDDGDWLVHPAGEDGTREPADEYEAEEEDAADDEGREPACKCGEIMGERCQWEGPTADTVVIEWMPHHLRQSHEAAGNAGQWPHSGAERLRVSRECAARITEDDPEWTRVVTGSL